MLGIVMVEWIDGTLTDLQHHTDFSLNLVTEKMRSHCFKTDFDVKGSLGSVLFCVIIISSLYLESSTTSMRPYMITTWCSASFNSQHKTLGNLPSMLLTKRDLIKNIDKTNNRALMSTDQVLGNKETLCRNIKSCLLLGFPLSLV